MVVPSEGMAMGQGSLLRLKMLTTHTFSLLLQKDLRLIERSLITCWCVGCIERPTGGAPAGWLGSVTGGARTEGIRALTERVGEGWFSDCRGWNRGRAAGTLQASLISSGRGPLERLWQRPWSSRLCFLRVGHDRPEQALRARLKFQKKAVFHFHSLSRLSV